MAERKRVLIVNCYWPETRVPMQLPNEMPMPLAPVHLAGHFAPRRWDIRLYNEVASGHLELFSPELIAWPDVVVFCGLTAAFDRFLHLSAYFRTRNPSVVTIAGGLAVRLLPTHAAARFDYACRGEVEEIREVIADAFGPGYVAEDPLPRYDLAHWMGRWIGYAESSRNCNFRCSFCTLTADALPWRGTDAGLFIRHLEAMGPRVLLHLADNQFAGAGRDAFAERLDVLGRARARGLFRWWAGFVTDAFLWDEENLRRAKESGCISLLIGVESFDNQWLRRMNKAQNVREPQQALIRRCLEAGILFQYGLVFDPTERRVADMERELDVIAGDPSIPAPNFMFVATPFPGTPFFADRHGPRPPAPRHESARSGRVHAEPARARRARRRSALPAHHQEPGRAARQLSGAPGALPLAVSRCPRAARARGVGADAGQHHVAAGAFEHALSLPPSRPAHACRRDRFARSRLYAAARRGREVPVVVRADDGHDG